MSSNRGPSVDSRSYVLDSALSITKTLGNWDEFASENDGMSSATEAIIGRPIWDFVSGIDTRAFLNTVFFMCRNEGLSYSTSYRCDAPNIQRVFQMRVFPDQHGLVVAHDTIDISMPERSTNVVAPSFGDMNRCSMCCAIKVDEQWLDTFAVIDIKDFPKTYGLCPTCRSQARTSLNDACGTVMALRA